MRHYRANNHTRFLEAVDELAGRTTLSRYQRSLKANAMLLSGRHKEALALYSTLAGEEGEGENAAYISFYARAMIADINGDRAGYARNASAASRLRTSYLVRQNLPL